MYETYKKSNLKRLYAEIKSLAVENYDVVISDFEPVSAWACLMKKKECIGLSHQVAVINKNAPKPRGGSLIGKTILKNYAPVKHKYGFHFKGYDSNIFTPVIRNEVRQIHPANSGHYTVYLPSYEDERIMNILKEAGDVTWQVFSKHSKKKYTKQNFIIRPISNDAFLASLATCAGVLCGAGFETPSEALFLKKKLMVIPMKGQYEQQCNAAALEQMNVDVIGSLKKKYVPQIAQWIKGTKLVMVDYPDITGTIIDMVIRKHLVPDGSPKLGQVISSLKEFKKYTLKNIISKS